MDATNHAFKLAARPDGLPAASDWDYATEPVPDPGDGEVVVKNKLVSLDPAMRGWMTEGPSYIPAVGIGEVMRAGAVGEVIESNSDGFAPGDHVTGMLGVQEYAVVDGNGLFQVDPDVAPLEVHLAALGMTGMTAYFGLLDIGKPEEGQTVVVSGAAGAVGSVVGQIAKIKGARAVGIAGGPEKCAWLVDELGFDAAIDYKNDDLGQALHKHCPDGADVYFDNVGGDTLDAVLGRLAPHARVVICGAISQYNITGSFQGPSNYMALLVYRARMEGFLVFDYLARFPEAVKEMVGWIDEGKLISRADVVEGLDTFPDTLLKLFEGENVGKLMIKVAD